MKEKIARRSLLKTFGAAAAVSSTACHSRIKAAVPAPVEPGKLPRVNLICAGMMLFWQDRNAPHAGITIYAPDAMGMHAVRLSEEIGGFPNHLMPGGPGTYTLAFTCANSKPLGPVDNTQNLVLYDTNPPTKDLKVNPMKAQYVLSVPYPTSIRRYRIMQFGSNPPYKVGAGNDTTSTFNIKPTQLSGVNVLTYDNVSSPVTLAMGASAPQTLAAQPPAGDAGYVLNLHFYATTDPKITPSPNHLQFFNALLSYKGHSMLDLAVTDPNYQPTKPGQEQVDGDLSQLDLYDLVELKPTGRVSDPAGCIGGWGS